MSGPILYDALAAWWPVLSAPEDYAEEAAYYARCLHDACDPPRASLLELGSGGGNNASHLKHVFDDVTLVDLSPGMLDVSRALNPECRHELGDMRTVRLGRRFDCVFVHDAVCYATSLEELGQVVETAYEHLRPGGATLFAPDYVRETFATGTDHGGHDGPGRSLRYLEWTWDPDPEDATYLVDYAFLLREADGTTRVVHDRHVEGLFAVDDWLGVFEAVGFRPRALRTRYSDEPVERVVFVGLKPG